MTEENLSKWALNIALSFLAAREKRGSYYGVWSSHCLVVGGISGQEEQMSACSWLLKGIGYRSLCIRSLKKAKKKNDPRVVFMMDAEALPIWLLFKLVSIWEHQQLLPHYRVTVWKITWQWRMCIAGLALTFICCVTLDHTFTHSVPWVSPLLKEGPLAVLRASDALILQVPSTEVLESWEPSILRGFLLPMPGDDIQWKITARTTSGNSQFKGM